MHVVKLERSCGREASKRVFLYLAIALLSALMQHGCAKKEEARPMEPPTVQVARVNQKDTPIFREWVATLDGDVNATIQAQVSGYLLRQTYPDGSFVKKGQVLFELDPRPYEALLAQSQAQLAQSEAQLAKSRMDVERDTPLAKQEAISQQQLDNDIQAYKANVASVAAAQAAVQQAQLNVGYTKVRSLIDGLAGIAKGQVGDLVGSTTVLTTVSTIHPIRAYFGLGENEYLRAAQILNAAAQGRDLYAGKSIIELILNDGSVYAYKGKFIAAARQIDPSTGSIIVAGAFPNPNNMLRPGQFAKVRFQVGMAKDALLVPQRAVTQLQGSYQVAVVGADNKVDIRMVEVGDQVGSDWIISKGLKNGDLVIVEGVQKVRQGVPVKTVPFEEQENTAASAAGVS
jgi:RND family efflux transporter MFP subunit